MDAMPTIKEGHQSATNILNLKDGEVSTVKEDKWAVLRCALSSRSFHFCLIARGVE